MSPEFDPGEQPQETRIEKTEYEDYYKKMVNAVPLLTPYILKRIAGDEPEPMLTIEMAGFPVKVAVTRQLRSGPVTKEVPAWDIFVSIDKDERGRIYRLRMFHDEYLKVCWKFGQEPKNWVGKKLRAILSKRWFRVQPCQE